MSMYDMMMGNHPLIKIFIVGLHLDPKVWPLGRFRDAYSNEACDKIIVLTRNGGGNREYLQDVMDNIKKHPNYISDADVPMDSTYAEIIFSVPEPLKEIMAQAKEISLGYKPFDVRFKELMKKLEHGDKEDTEVKQVIKNTEPLMKAIQAFIDQPDTPKADV